MTNVLLLVAQVTHLVAVMALGLFAGAMLTEAGVLVPHWRSIDAQTFHAWYRSNATRSSPFSDR